MANGVDENGRLTFDGVEGMKIEDAMEIRDTYPDNVGTIVVTFTEAQLKAAMADDRIDFIIPFHRSQWTKKQYGRLGLPADTKDMTYWQNERYFKGKAPTRVNKNGKTVREKAKNFMPNTYWNFKKDGKTNAESYLKMCAEANKKPKFWNLLVDNKDGSYSLQPDGSTDGYWKLLGDFKMYNHKTGKGVPQKPVKPDFNMTEANRVMSEYKGGHESFPVAQDVVNEFVRENGGAKLSRKLTTEQKKLVKEYKEALKSGDKDWQAQVVNFYGATKGYTTGAYHGSPYTDITVFNTRSTGEKPEKLQLLFGTHFTQNRKYAELYESKTKKSKGTSRMSSKKGKIYDVLLDLGKSLDLRTVRNYHEGDEMFALYQDLPPKIKRKVPLFKYSERDAQDGLGKAGEEFVTIADIELGLQAMSPKDATDFLVSHGYNSVLYVAKYANGFARYVEDPSIIMLDPERIKSADPVTYDKNGDPVPLEERFDNKKNEIRFSRKGQDAAMRRANRLARENARLKGQFKLTKGVKLRESDIRKVTRDLLKDYTSSMDAKVLEMGLGGLYEQIINETDDERNLALVREYAEHLAKRLVDDALVDANDYNKDAFQNVKSFVTKENALAIPDDVDEEWLKEFRDKHKGRIGMKRKGRSVAEAYKELSEEFPIFFPEDTSGTKAQLEAIGDVLESLDAIFINPHSNALEDAYAEATIDIMNRVAEVREEKARTPAEEAARAKRIEERRIREKKRRYEKELIELEDRLAYLKRWIAEHE